MSCHVRLSLAETEAQPPRDIKAPKEKYSRKLIESFFTFGFQILIHIGVLSNEDKMHFAKEATKGGPLGELVQWSDVIASLYMLGHDITVSADLATVQR